MMDENRSVDEAPSANRIFFALAGIVAGLGVPLLWLLWRAFSARRAWWMSWIRNEIGQHEGGYIMLGIVAVIGLGILGYWLGRRIDEVWNESQSVDAHNLALSRLATTDELTGLFNLRYMNERLEAAIMDSHRSALTCLLVDIDHFKRINDTYGHPFGDRVLAEVAGILKRSVRRIDTVGRIGGEEFLVILPDTPKSSALAFGERIRQAVCAKPQICSNEDVPVTVSVGVVTYPCEGIRRKDDLLRAVDEALYAAKKNGRNRVIVWNASSST